MNDLDLLRSLRTDLEAGDRTPPGRIRYQLVNHLTTTRRPARRARIGWALAGAVSVVALSVVAGAVLHTTGDGEPAGVTDLSAAQALMLAADHSELAPTTTGSYWLTASETHTLKLAGTTGTSTNSTTGPRSPAPASKPSPGRPCRR